MIIPERIVFNPVYDLLPRVWVHATKPRYPSADFEQVRTSLHDQGLDYVTSAGAEAFDNLCDVLETLGDVGIGMGWAKQQENNLRASKRYLKGAFKVGVTRAGQIPPPLYVTHPRSLSFPFNMASAITHSGFSALKNTLYLLLPTGAYYPEPSYVLYP